MCNINILLSKNKFKDENINNIICFMQSTTSASFLSNNHADGVYFNGTNNIYKSNYKLNFLNYIEDIKESDLIITHQRWATSGFNDESDQPFLKDGFVFVHNGVLSEYATKDKSDSLNLFHKIIDLYNKNKDKGLNNDDLMILSIKSCLEDVLGSYSIMIYDINNKIIYYFKNSSTNISFFKGKDKLYITTKEDNHEFNNFLGQKIHKLKIKDNSIYKIYIENDIKIHKIGKIKHKTYFNSNNKTINNVNLVDNKPTSTYYDNLGITLMDKSMPCMYCKTPTFRYDNIYHEIVCLDCSEGLEKTPKYV